MAREQLDRPAQHVGRDLHPERGSPRRRPRRRRAARRGRSSSNSLDMVAKAEHHALERRPPDVAEAVMEAEADQRAARMDGSCSGVFSPRK